MKTYHRILVGAAATALCGTALGGGGALAQGKSGDPQPRPLPKTSTASFIAGGGSDGAKTAAKCPYPYVCFTKGTTILSKYKDAGHWQKLGPRGRKADSATNTRKDDVVYVTFSNAAKICMKPGEGWAFNGAKPREVFISTSSKCHGAG